MAYSASASALSSLRFFHQVSMSTLVYPERLFGPRFPGLEDLVLLLAGTGVGDALDRVRTKFPTSATAVLTWHGAWPDLRPGEALLTRLEIPRGHRPP